MRPAVLVSLAALWLAAAPALAQAPPGAGKPMERVPIERVPMERVEGIGGVFFRAKDPKALAQWYADHIGVNRTPTSYGQQPWRQAAGPTAFQPFPANSKFFERAEQMFMLNFRVKDLDAMVAQLRRDGIAVEVDPQTYPNGRFAETHDPEGNPIQLWQYMEPKP